ncbi:MAG TPA: FAD-dependent monooxygenase, partial [Usitatibacteraceae bacterium]|nr:FAD-dependent monooxygenase [Usitatibacteraceae bacterium]
LICGAQVAGLVTNEREARITLKDGRTLEGSLLIAADSRFSAARRQMGIAAHMHDFGREVIVCRMAHEAQGDGVAHECFHWGRTLAILPMNKKEVSVVMTVKTPDAQALADLSAEALAREVEAQFGGRLGAMRLVGARHRYPLVAVYARRFVARRFALIGDAAVGMHPVTAHGYNFGLYGVECLTRQMRDAREAGRDFAGEAVLAAYQRAHRRETFAIFAGTNALVKLFTDERRIARVVRPRLLKLANRLPPLKAWITRHLTDVPGPRGPGRLIAQLKSLRG